MLESLDTKGFSGILHSKSCTRKYEKCKTFCINFASFWCRKGRSLFRPLCEFQVDQARPKCVCIF